MSSDSSWTAIGGQWAQSSRSMRVTSQKVELPITGGLPASWKQTRYPDMLQRSVIYIPTVGDRQLCILGTYFGTLQEFITCT